MESAPIEEPVEDVVEQLRSVTADDDEETVTVDTGAGEVDVPTGAPSLGAGWDVDEGDAVEQSREIPLDEDDWR